MDTHPSELPPLVRVFKMTPKALAIAKTVLEAVKGSQTPVTQMLQDTVNVPESRENGIRRVEDIPMAAHYKCVADFEAKIRASGGKNRQALYMTNKSLIEVVGADLTKQLYAATQGLSEDVLVNYPRLYQSDNPRASNDVLVGSTLSWSPVHQDLPLYCTSVIAVLEGHKQFVLLHDDAVSALRVNTSGGAWDQPVRHKGKHYPDLQSFVSATDGVVVDLRAGQLLVMPPRVFHLARNVEQTTSCNFSCCTMDQVPMTVSQTFASIVNDSRDPSFMLFDVDFARLLEDCTEALLKRQAATPGISDRSITHQTKRGKLPPLRDVLENHLYLYQWYLALRCIPKGWVMGFWGDMRTRLLARLEQALPLRGSQIGCNGVTAAEAAAAPPPAAAMEYAGADDTALVTVQAPPAPGRGGAGRRAQAAQAHAIATATTTTGATKRSHSLAASLVARGKQHQQRRAGKQQLGSGGGSGAGLLAPRMTLRKRRAG